MGAGSTRRRSLQSEMLRGKPAEIIQSLKACPQPMSRASRTRQAQGHRQTTQSGAKPRRRQSAKQARSIWQPLASIEREDISECLLRYQTVNDAPIPRAQDNGSGNSHSAVADSIRIRSTQVATGRYHTPSLPGNA